MRAEFILLSLLVIPSLALVNVDEKNRPVTKVINLLKDMVTQLEKESENDEEVYETMGCWCVTNEKLKTKSIADGETSIEELTANIEAYTADAARLNEETAKLKSDVAKEKDALDKATALREKELAEFTAEEKETLVNINGIKAAIVSLSKHHDASLTAQKAQVQSTHYWADMASSEAKTPLAQEVMAKDTRLSLNAARHNHTHAALKVETTTTTTAPLQESVEDFIHKHAGDFLNAFVQVHRKALTPNQMTAISSFLQGPMDDDFSDLTWTWHRATPAPKMSALSAHTHVDNQISDIADRPQSDILEFLKEEAGRTSFSFRHGRKSGRHSPINVQSLLSEILEQAQSTEDSDRTSSGEPRSAEIFGIMKQMQENFETNLEGSQKDETKNQEDYEHLKAAKEEQIAAGQAQIDTKEVTLAGVNEKNAEAKEMLEDTQQTLAVDTKFLADLKERCANMDDEFEKRTKARQLEIEAVSKALAFLSSDEAHDLFTRTFNPAFFQRKTSQKNRRTVLMSKFLRATARKFNDPRIALLAAGEGPQNPVFDKIKEKTNLLIDNLTKEKWDEIKEKDYCVGEFNSNERDRITFERDRDDLSAKIEGLKVTIDSLDKAIEVLKNEIADLQIQLKRAGQDREKENQEFQATVADQRATQKLLKASLGILKGFYTKGKFELVQKGHSASSQATGQAPPPGFKSYEKSASSGGVMGMMQEVISEAEAMEAQCLYDEKDAQMTYEKFVKDTNESVDQKTKDMVNKGEAKAKAEGDLVQARTDLDDKLTELEELYNFVADLHKRCDFLLKEFDGRQAARDEEIEALRQSIRIFSGASFEVFLEQQGLAF